MSPERGSPPDPESVRSRAVLDALEEGVMLLTGEGLVAVNPAGERILGYDLAGLREVGTGWQVEDEHGRRLGVEELPGVQVLQGGEPLRGVLLRTRRADGAWVWLLANVVPLPSTEASVAPGVVVSFSDVTELRATQEALEEERDRERALVDAMQDGLVEGDLDRRITHVNERFCEMVGFSRGELVGGLPPHPFWPTDRYAEFEAWGPPGNAPLAPGQRTSLQRKDGTEMPVAISLGTAHDADGRPIGRIGVVRDLTLELEVERVQRETQERLAASEARFRTAMDSMLDGLIVYSAVRDDQGRLVDLMTEYANEAVVRHEGRPPEEQVGRTMHELYPNCDEDGVFERYVQVVEEGEPATLEIRYSDAAIDGVYDLQVAPLGDGCVVTFREISERRRIEAAAREHDLALAALRAQEERQRLTLELARVQRLESLGRVAAGVAHDFNNLLGVIGNYAAYVEKHLANGDPLVDDVRRIRDATGAATQLTRQLLLFGRQEPATGEPLDAEAIVTDVLTLMARPLGDAVEVVHSADETPLRVLAPRGLVDQVLVNLLLNARDAMPDGGKVEVTTSVVTAEPGANGELEPGRYLAFRVADSGPGMPVEAAEHAFEPFFSTKPGAHGTGLGLSTAYGIVRALGGTVRIESSEGMGTTVTVLVPAVEPEEETAMERALR